MWEKWQEGKTVMFAICLTVDEGMKEKSHERDAKTQVKQLISLM